MREPVSFTGQRGAGVYGRVPDPPAHRCGKCANPHTGGREDCPNNRRASQQVPYMESGYEFDE